MDASVTGTVFNIQRYSIHDGPGIRTVVFLKGCPLRCLWCSNPESQSPHIQIMAFDEKCSGCGICLNACPEGARVLRGGKAATIRERCRACGNCVEACPNEAARMVGRLATVEDVIRTVEKDRPFYEESGGGVTLSGGEPASQPLFAAEILRRCHDRLIHTAIETTGCAAWDDLHRIMDHTDLVLYDLKHMDPDRHRELTGVSNELALQNAEAVSKMGKTMVFRMPLIPGYNNDPANLAAVSEFAKSLGVNEIDLLPYHEYGRAKYDRLGRQYPLAGLGGIEAGDPVVSEACHILSRAGLRVLVGG